MVLLFKDIDPPAVCAPLVSSEYERRAYTRIALSFCRQTTIWQPVVPKQLLSDPILGYVKDRLDVTHVLDLGFFSNGFE